MIPVICGWKCRALLAVITSFVFFQPRTLSAQAERILDYNSDIVIHSNSSLTVTETIKVYAAGKKIKRGIYRDFPQLYRGKFWLRQKTGFAVVSVKRNGKPEPFHMKNRKNGKRVYIGSKKVHIPKGEHTYEITYRTDRQLGFFDKHDELYWNVTGNDWAFPILKASAVVRLPAGARVTSAEAYTGRKDAKGRDYTSSGLGSNTVSFTTTSVLAPGEGLTIVVGWPKGFVKASTQRDKWLRLAGDNLGVILAVTGLLLVLVYYAIVWVAVGRDPAPGTIIPLYGPPKGFSPAAVRNLVEMGFDNKSFAAALIDLAVKGAITIQKEDKDYIILRKNLEAPGLSSDEKIMLKKLVGSSSSLKLVNKNHATIRGARKAAQKLLAAFLEKTYFVRNLRYWFPGLLFSLVPIGVSLVGTRKSPEALFMLVWLTGWTVGVTVLLSQCVSQWFSRNFKAAMFLTLFSIPFVIGECVGIVLLTKATSVFVPILFLIGAGMNAVFYHLLKAPTSAGRRILDKIDGFRMYLSVAEKDRLNLENPPERTPQLFEMFLPYALALDVEQIWAEQFQDVLAAAEQDSGTYSPSWYSGAGWSALGAGSFASSLGSSLSSAISSSSAAPGSSSGGGGGGSSGGGGGGGGGGGW